MKKFLAATFLAMVVFCGTAFAYEAAVTGTCENVSQSGNLKRCTFTSTTSVITGSDKVFRLTFPAAFGNIRDDAFESSSPDLDYWLSTADAKTATALETLIHRESVNLGSFEVYNSPIFYRNGDTATGPYMYLTIKNDSATATGTWKYIVTVDPFGIALKQ